MLGTLPDVMTHNLAGALRTLEHHNYNTKSFNKLVFCLHGPCKGRVTHILARRTASNLSDSEEEDQPTHSPEEHTSTDTAIPSEVMASTALFHPTGPPESTLVFGTASLAEDLTSTPECSTSSSTEVFTSTPVIGTVSRRLEQDAAASSAPKVALERPPMKRPLDTPARSKTTQKRAIEKTDVELEDIDRRMNSHRPMSAAAHFGLTLEPYIAATPPEMLHHLQIELLHIASSCSRGIYPNSVMLTTFPRVDMHDG
ncbi:hypothetical protein HPB48_016821 [Haemaphysalis longicornis]|uniref:Uncharacterized protein n=1 Tax=Haemaphysalis longicornis TaxID=44386 RepID=A0A9J6GJZ6_HAELO|nr:hypothetical protein HPB48_016821 [Haemaphysalis longicornis]